jgi:hypothetical protein
MATIQDLEDFLRACRGRDVYDPEVDARFRRCVSAAVANGFGGSDLSGLESASDRKFVLRRVIDPEHVGSYAASFKTLVRDYEEYLANPESFLNPLPHRKVRPRRFQKRKPTPEIHVGPPYPT